MRRAIEVYGNADPATVRAVREGRAPEQRMETREVRRGGFGDVMAGILAGGYRRSAWGGLPSDRRDALMQSYMEQSASLMQVQAGGGAPIMDWSAMPSMLAEASRSYGPNVAPEIPARVVGGFTRAMTQPQGDVMRGAAMRSVMNLGRGMSGEQLEDFKKKTGGIDLRSYTGVLEAIQNSAALPTEQRQQVMRAVLQGYRGLTGKGTEFERIMWTGMTGGQAHIGRKATELADRFLEGTITPEQTTEFEKMFRQKADEAGSEAHPFINAARADELAITAGEPLKRLGQAVAEAVYDFVDKVREAENALETGVLQSPAIGASESRP